jgi:hypothetical protein
VWWVVELKCVQMASQRSRSMRAVAFASFPSRFKKEVDSVTELEGTFVVDKSKKYSSQPVKHAPFKI